MAERATAATRELAEWCRVLGVDAAADGAAVVAARRRLAKELHPDTGGDPDAMRRVNVAADGLLALLAAPAAASTAPQSGPPPPAPSSSSTPPPSSPATPGPTSSPGQRIDHDVASFTIEALPVEAFEALLVVTSWIGEVIVDEPPYQLDVLLTDRLRCWCRLDLVPDAGATTVAVTIGTLPDEALPDIDAVRDLWVGCLNHLGADEDATDAR